MAERVDFLQELTPEIALLVLSFLRSEVNEHQLGIYCLVSKTWHAFIRDQTDYWMVKLEKLFPSLRRSVIANGGYAGDPADSRQMFRFFDPPRDECVNSILALDNDEHIFDPIIRLRDMSFLNALCMVHGHMANFSADFVNRALSMIDEDKSACVDAIRFVLQSDARVALGIQKLVMNSPSLAGSFEPAVQLNPSKEIARSEHYHARIPSMCTSLVYRGSYPVGLPQLKNLTYLSLRECGFRGELFDAIKDFACLPNLENLDLSLNGIESWRTPLHLNDDAGGGRGVPPAFASSLRKLDLSFNNLQAVSDGVAIFPNLTSLNLSRNNIQVISAKISELHHLERLNLAMNSLATGDSFPDSFASLRKLRVLSLSQNRLQEVPLVFCNLAALERLELDFNSELTRVPCSTKNLVGLRSFVLSNGNVRDIPELPPNLVKCRLQNNRIVDVDCIGNLSMAELIDVSHNSIRRLPRKVCEIRSLTTLNVSNNSLTELPRELNETNLPNLRYLDVSNNSLLLKIRESISKNLLRKERL